MGSGPLLFDHFEVITDDLGAPIRLGPGGMGTTYKAFDTRLRKTVALKLINDRLVEDPTSRTRFFNEARAAALLDHPNIARVLYLCPENAVQCFFAMEFVDGESLASRVARHGPIAPMEALLLLRPVADALQALAEHQLVHRDIKPENIMLARTGSIARRVKLIDFGLAKALDGNTDLFASVHTGERFVGSVYFASPEQIRSKERLDARSDFYSLGATLWHMLTGFPPFTGTVFEVQEAHVYREPAWDKIAEAPAPVSQLIHRLLAKPREARPATAAELLAEWDAASAALEGDRAAATKPLAAAGNQTQAEVTLTTAGQAAPASSSSAPLAVALKEAPAGIARPSAGATLVQSVGTGEVLLVRALPARWPEALRNEVIAAARMVAENPEAGLLAIREVRENEVVYAWPPGCLVGRMLSQRKGELPLESLLRWLPAWAATYEWAAGHELPFLTTDPNQWLAVFEELGAGEKAEQRLALPPENWGRVSFRIDPLGGARVRSTSDDTVGAQTIINTPDLPLDTPADFVAALAMAVRILLGGRPGRETPVAGLNEAANELLAAPMRTGFTSTSPARWAAAFAEACAREGPRTRRSSSRIPSPPPLAKPPDPTRIRRVVAAAACLMAVVAAFFFLRSPQPVPEDAPSETEPTEAVAETESSAATEEAPAPEEPAEPTEATPVAETEPAVESPSEPEQNGEIRTALRRFIRDFLAANSWKDVSLLPRFFAPEVDYFDEGVVSVDYIRRDVEKYNLRWPQQTQTLASPPEVVVSPDESSAKAVIVLDFEVRNGAAYIRGQTEDRMVIDLSGGAPHIVSIKSTVTNRERSAATPPTLLRRVFGGTKR